MNNLKTKQVMDFLIKQSKSVRSNNLKISGWVSSYLNICLLQNEKVNILTPWSLSKAFEKRFVEQGELFHPDTKRKKVV